MSPIKLYPATILAKNKKIPGILKREPIRVRPETILIQLAVHTLQTTDTTLITTLFSNMHIELY